MAKSTIVLLEDFNNYFNRKIKKYDTLASYTSNYTYLTLTDINFNENNEVSTEIIFNYDQVSINPNYLLVVDPTNSTILARWFILESSRTRLNQYRLKLRRDTIADFFDEILTSPVFVHKAHIEDNDPFIFNSEGMSFNQVKVGELLLKDQTKTAWIVGYLARSLQTETITASAYGIGDDSYTLTDIEELTGISEQTLTAMINTDGQATNSMPVYQNMKLIFQAKASINDPQHRDFHIDISNSFYFENPYSFQRLDGTTTNIFYSNDTLTNYLSVNQTMIKLKGILNNDRDNIKSDLSLMVSGDIITLEQANLLSQYISQKPILYQGNYYRASSSPNGTLTPEQTRQENWQLHSHIRSDINASLMGNTTTNANGLLRFYYKTIQYSIMLTPIEDKQVSLRISSSRNVLAQKPYDMICMPYDDFTYLTQPTTTETGGTYDETNFLGISGNYRRYLVGITTTIASPYSIENVVCDNAYDIEWEIVDGYYHIRLYFRRPRVAGEITNPVPYTCYYTKSSQSDKLAGAISRRIASAMPPQLSDNLYDIQLLPYCPLQEYINGNSIDITDMIEDRDYSFIKDSSNNIKGICFYCINDSFQVAIKESIVSHESSLKVENECNAYRLVSPNYQGSFNFSIAKNGGQVSTFNAFCTYKPYTPYIKVAPAFARLYGMEYNDNRGLICSGDFSLPQIRDKWEDYQLNNKNYQNIFNRDIQNLDFNQSLEMRQQIISASVGAISDAVSGGQAGAMLGGGLGAGIGAGVGGVASLIGGIADTSILAQQHKEQRGYAFDKYNYTLGNIKALPYTLTKVSSWDINSKIFPFVEFYSCTDEEKEAFESKLKYESMTIMRVGTLQEFIKPEEHYFKGELIRCENISGTTEIIMSIYEELMKGVYIHE